VQSIGTSCTAAQHVALNFDFHCCWQADRWQAESGVHLLLLLLLIRTMVLPTLQAERKCASSCRVSDVVNLWHATAQRSHLARALQGCGVDRVTMVCGPLGSPARTQQSNVVLEPHAEVTMAHYTYRLSAGGAQRQPQWRLLRGSQGRNCQRSACP
jgi:hypothetical protein